MPPMNLKHTVRPIRQYDLQGNFIAEYENATLAAQMVFNDSSKGLEIRNACNQKVQIAYGFQ